MAKSHHYVYKYVLNGEIIYIGKTDRPIESRLNNHGKHGDNISESHWKELAFSEIYFCRLANATMADVVETEMIRRHKPRLNKAKVSEWSGLDFSEPKWEKYIPDISHDVQKRNCKTMSSIEKLTLQKQQIDNAEQELRAMKQAIEWLKRFVAGRVELVQIPFNMPELKVLLNGVAFNIIGHGFMSVNTHIQIRYCHKNKEYSYYYLPEDLKRWETNIEWYEKELLKIKREYSNQ